MKSLRMTSIVLAVAAAWWDWRLGAAAIACLGVVCGSLLQRLHEQRILAELSERLQRSASVEEAWQLVPQYVRRLRGRRLFGRLAAAAATARLAREVASRVDLAVDNLRVQEELRTRAIRDSLTGLFNRRWIEETMFGSIEHAGVIVADVDHFKSYNDRWGHAGGDALLQQLARLMQCLFRDDDVVCRLGGEEFVIILPETPFEEVRACAERLVEESRRLAVHLDGELLGAITLSAGIAVSPHHAATVEGLISAADHALYAAKRAGRDRVATPPHHVVGLDAA